jgi:hypothetical protein
VSWRPSLDRRRPRQASWRVAGGPRSLSGLADPLEPEKVATENQLLRGRIEQVAS